MRSVLYSRRRHASRAARLDHRRRLPRHLLRARAAVRQARRQEHGRVLRVGPRGAVVARRPLDGRHHLQQRHAQPRHRHRPQEWRRGKLGVVGVRADRRRDGVLLRAAVAAVGRDDRPRVLRDPLLREGREPRARLPRRVPGAALQLHDHGDGQPRRVQDRRHPVRARALADPRLRRAPERRLCGALRPLGRARHRHGPVLHQDDGGHRRGVLRAAGAAGGRAARADDEAVVDARPERRRLPEHPAGLQEPLGHRGRRVRHADRGAVVGRLVSRRRARRRQLHRAAHARVEVGEGRAWRRALLQHRALRAAPVALDHHGALLDSGVPGAERHPEGVSGARSAPARPRHRVSRRC